MEDLIQVFRMSELSVKNRISIIKKLGDAINRRYAANITESLVYELVLTLDPDDEIKENKKYLSFLSN